MFRPLNFKRPTKFGRPGAQFDSHPLTGPSFIHRTMLSKLKTNDRGAVMKVIVPLQGEPRLSSGVQVRGHIHLSSSAWETFGILQDVLRHHPLIQDQRVAHCPRGKS
jgi:hypothetical protein